MGRITAHSRDSRRTRRLVHGSAVALAGILAVAGCSSASPTSAPTTGPASSPIAAPESSPTGAPSATVAQVTLTLAIESTGDQAPPEQVLAQKYSALHPEVQFDVQRTSPDTYSQVLLTQLQAGNGPDIFYGTAGYGSQHSLAPLGDAGLALSLSGTPAEDLLKSTGQTGLYQGKSGDIYGQPENLVPLGIVFNKTAFDKLNLTYPKTFDELLAQCRTSRAAGINYFSEPSGDDLAGVVMAASNVYSADPNWHVKRQAGQVTFADSQGWVATLNDYLKLKDSGCFQAGVAGATNETAFADVASGKSLGVIMPAGVILDLQTANPNVDYVIAPFPGHTEATTRVFASSTDALGVNAKLSAEKKDAALKFLAWLAEPDQSAQLADATRSMPISALKGGTIDAGAIPAIFKPLAGILSDPTRYQPFDEVLWPNGAIGAALLDGMTGLLTGQATVKDVLTSMDQAWTK